MAKLVLTDGGATENNPVNCFHVSDKLGNLGFQVTTLCRDMKDLVAYEGMVSQAYSSNAAERFSLQKHLISR